MQQPPDISLFRLARSTHLLTQFPAAELNDPFKVTQEAHEYLVPNDWKTPFLLANFLNYKIILPVWSLVSKQILTTVLLSSTMPPAQPSVSLLPINTLFHLSYQDIFASLAKLFKLLSLQQSHCRTTSAAIAGPVSCFLRCRWKSDLHLGGISHSSSRWMAVDPPSAAWRGASQVTLCVPPSCTSRTASLQCLYWVNSAHNLRLNIKYFLQGK